MKNTVLYVTLSFFLFITVVNAQSEVKQEKNIEAYFSFGATSVAPWGSYGTFYAVGFGKTLNQKFSIFAEASFRSGDDFPKDFFHLGKNHRQSNFDDLVNEYFKGKSESLHTFRKGSGSFLLFIPTYKLDLKVIDLDLGLGLGLGNGQLTRFHINDAETVASGGTTSERLYSKINDYSVSHRSDLVSAIGPRINIDIPLNERLSAIVHTNFTFVHFPFHNDIADYEWYGDLGIGLRWKL